LQARIDAFRASGGELIPLQIGDTYLTPPPRARAALEALPAGALGSYGGVPGLTELRSALATRLADSGHATVRGASEIHVGAGCTHALFCAARALLDPGDEVLVVTPYWPLIVGVLATVGAVPIEVPVTGRLHRESEVDVAALLGSATTERTRALYFSSPGNPDGYVLGQRELGALAAFAEAYDLWVLSDEVYADFVYEGVHRPFATLPGMAARTVTCHSLSKSHALAGARVGYVSAPEHVIDAVRRMSNHTIYNVPVAMQRVALAAVEDGHAFLADARRLYRDARDAASERLREHGIAHDVPRGGSFIFVDLDAPLGPHSLTRALELGIDHGVLLAPGDAFGASHGRSARLCFTGVPTPDVLRGIDRFAAALTALALETPR
jgi:aspartate/methionine/tyrosine aminotransferase